MLGEVIRFEGIRNIRDLGGRTTLDGRRVVRGRLYRSGSIHAMTRRDKFALEALGVRTVIDLRTESERRQHSADWAQIDTVWAPLVGDDYLVSLYARFKAGTVSSEELEDWWRLARVFRAPWEYSFSIRLIFDALLEVDSGDAVLFHCQGGKDRTGMVSALLLEALTVSSEEIVTDFLLSNGEVADERQTTEIAAIVEAAAPNLLSRDALMALQGVKREWLETLFDRIEDRAGSVASYLSDRVGVGDRALERLRETYLEPATDDVPPSRHDPA